MFEKIRGKIRGKLGRSKEFEEWNFHQNGEVGGKLLSTLAKRLDVEKRIRDFHMEEGNYPMANYIVDSMTATRGFFIDLTICALDDEALAKHLTGIYSKIVKKSMYHKGFFWALDQLLKSHHEFEGMVPKEKILERITVYMNGETFEETDELFDIVKKEMTGELSKKERENLMFG